MRLIDADELVNLLENNLQSFEEMISEHGKGVAHGTRIALGLVKEQPTITQESLQPQWIPVKEKLPDENQPVCILLENGNVFRAEIRMQQLLKEWWYRYDPTDEDMDMLGIHYEVEGWTKENPIVAWMPLSEPYTSAGEEAEHGTTE